MALNFYESNSRGSTYNNAIVCAVLELHPAFK